MGHEFRHSLDVYIEFYNSVIKVLTKVMVSYQTQLGKDPHSHGGCQDSVPQGCWTEGLVP